MTIFAVDPGSKTSVKMRDPRSAPSTLPGLFGSTLGASAAVRILPVLISLMTTDPDSALCFFTCSAIACRA